MKTTSVTVNLPNDETIVIQNKEVLNGRGVGSAVRFITAVHPEWTSLVITVVR